MTFAVHTRAARVGQKVRLQRLYFVAVCFYL
jgi:hypothetical protein